MIRYQNFRSPSLADLFQMTRQSTSAISTPKGKLENVYKLELDGPILPHNLAALCELFRISQKGDFATILKYDDTTEQMNIRVGESSMNLASGWRFKKIACENGKNDSPFVVYHVTL